MNIIFWLIIVILLGLAVYAVLASVIHQTKADKKNINLNTSIHKQKLAELELARQEGLLDEESHRAAEEELARALLQETPANQTDNNTSNSSKKPIYIVAALIPVMAISLYLYKGRHLAIDPDLYPRQSENKSSLSLQSVIDQLKKKLDIGDEDADTWYMLGRAYLDSNQLEKAKQAFANAMRLRQDRAEVILDYAEVMARLNQNRFEPQAKQLVEQALQLEPNSRRARWLSSVIAMQDQHTDRALSLWQQLLSEGTDSAEEQQMLELLLARHGDETATPTTTAQPESNLPNIQVRVSISPDITNQISESDAVFIFARAAQGPKIPLAVVRKQVADLPITVSLSDDQAMTPAMKLSSFDTIVVGARISKTGNAIPSSGDFQSISDAFAWKEQGLMELSISDRVP